MLNAIAIDDRHRAKLVEMNLESALVVPILAGDVVFGTIQLLRFQPVPAFTKDEVDLANDVAIRIGAMFENARLLRRAQAAIAARDQFLSIAAHELRTPLASIKGYAQLLSRSFERGSLTPERLNQALRTIETSVSRLSNLTDDLLGMSLRGAQTLPLRNQTINIPSFLRSIVERSEPLHDHPIVLDPNVAQVNVFGDVGKLEQVMFNLLNNASKYSRSGAPIHISAARDGPDVDVAVTDQGIGLVPGEQERIFQPFGRSEVAGTSRIPGLGLGLYICKGIIERHQGRIWAESAGRNQGTSFHILLPIQEDDGR